LPFPSVFKINTVQFWSHECQYGLLTPCFLALWVTYF
jgi:hypothetical protein